jgi:hypothetical protein
VESQNSNYKTTVTSSFKVKAPNTARNLIQAKQERVFEKCPIKSRDITTPTDVSSTGKSTLIKDSKAKTGKSKITAKIMGYARDDGLDSLLLEPIMK